MDEHSLTYYSGPISENHDRHFIFFKWFFFVTTSMTTIGYGQVHPKTDNGRLFFILFSLVGISLMMTLLKSCSDILYEANKRLCMWIARYIKYHKYISNELMSVVSLTCLYLVFMLLVVWHDRSIPGVSPHSLITTFYYWTVTFTTVGFGDVVYPLEAEIHHLYIQLANRLTGLTFLTGIIDSIQKYMKYRKGLVLDKARIVSRIVRDNSNYVKVHWS